MSCQNTLQPNKVLMLYVVFGDTLRILHQTHPTLGVALPTLTHIAPLLRDLTRNWPIQPKLVLDPAEKRAAFAVADVALAASGTVSLELAANQTPMVIAYKMHPLTWLLMQRAALIDTVTLVNLVSETRLVPDFLGPDCRADLIAPAVLILLADSHAQDAAMQLTMKRLGEGGEPPGLRAARSVLAHL